MGIVSDAATGGDVRYRLQKIEDQIRDLQTARRLEAAAIGAGGLTVKGGAIVVQDGTGAETLRLSTAGLTLEGLLEVLGSMHIEGSILIDTGDLLAIDNTENRWVAFRAGRVEFGRISPEGTDAALAEVRANNQDLTLNANFNAFVNGDNQTSIDSAGGSVFVTAPNGSISLEDGAGGPVAGGIFLQANSGVFYIGHPTTGAAANAVLDAGTGLLLRSTSSRRYKVDVADYRTTATILDLAPRTYRDRGEAERDPAGARTYVGLVAEEVHQLGLTEYVTYDQQGRPDAVMYDRLAVGLLGVVADLTAWAVSKGYQPPPRADRPEPVTQPAALPRPELPARLPAHRGIDKPPHAEQQQPTGGAHGNADQVASEGDQGGA